MKGDRLREEMNSIDEPPLKTWFWELEAAVIEADRCVQCGVCVAVCPSNSIGVQALTNVPELVRMCTGCSLCWDFCPRAGLRYEATWHDDAGDDDERAVSAGRWFSWMSRVFTCCPAWSRPMPPRDKHRSCERS